MDETDIVERVAFMPDDNVQSCSRPLKPVLWATCPLSAMLSEGLLQLCEGSYG